MDDLFESIKDVIESERLAGISEFYLSGRRMSKRLPKVTLK